MKLTTPTQFILQSAKKTPVIHLPMDKKIEYKFEDYPEVKDRYCFLCGGETGFHGTARRKTIKESFSDIQIARQINSQSCCSGCSFCLSHNSEPTKAGLCGLNITIQKNTIFWWRNFPK